MILAGTHSPCQSGLIVNVKIQSPSQPLAISSSEPFLPTIRYQLYALASYNSTRIFTLSIRPLWHGLCVPARIMAQGQTTFRALIAIGCILVFPYHAPAQQSTAPPSSLSTRPLSPESAESEIHGSCDLCRKPEGRTGSDLRPQRLHREKGTRPHKSEKGTHRSLDQIIKSTLPHRPLVPAEVQGQQDSQTRRPAE